MTVLEMIDRHGNEVVNFGIPKMNSTLFQVRRPNSETHGIPDFFKV
jgi:hypothetical protein